MTRVVVQLGGLLLRCVAFAVGVVVLGAGVPLAWVWVASQVEGSVGGGTDALSALTLIVGIPSTYALVTLLAHHVGRRDATGPRRSAAWNRPIGGDGREHGPTTRLEALFVSTTLIVAVVVEVHLVFFAHPGVPSGP